MTQNDPRPRYQALAADLRAHIESDAYPVGSTLPTEHELCEANKVSRHTAREALRLLLEDGLIARRRGVGTIVVRKSDAPAFAQPLGGLDDLMKYARNAKLQVVSYGEGMLGLGEARRLGAPRQWSHKTLKGLRALPGQPPLGLTHIHIDAKLAPSDEDVGGLTTSVTEWIEHKHGVQAAQIKQIISAILLDANAAIALDAVQGAAGLRTVRRYCDPGGRVFVVSDSIHPTDRFSYEMTVQRDKPSA
ncbi:MAG: GntR family transcriptional regulator [Pseudomonadota bacterium]